MHNRGSTDRTFSSGPSSDGFLTAAPVRVFSRGVKSRLLVSDWLAQPAACRDSKLIDAPSHKIKPAEVVSPDQRFRFWRCCTPPRLLRRRRECIRRAHDAHRRSRWMIGAKVAVFPEESLASARRSIRRP